MNIRRFNADGLARFAAWLGQLNECPDLPVPVALLEDPSITDSLGTDIPIELRVFPRRFEAAEYLYERLHNRGLREPERDAGLWAWLTLLYFDQVCPADGHGRRKARKDGSYIPLVDNRLRYYRHLLLGPYVVRKALDGRRTSIEFLLAPSLDVATDEVYRLLVEGPLIQSEAAVGAVTSLYWDANRATRKRGVGVKEAGGMRRFVEVLQQFDRTYDLHAMRVDRVLGFLPREFDKFRREGSRVRV